jgi:hypothetical protein
MEGDVWVTVKECVSLVHDFEREVLVGQHRKVKEFGEGQGRGCHEADWAQVVGQRKSSRRVSAGKKAPSVTSSWVSTASPMGHSAWPDSLPP